MSHVAWEDEFLSSQQQRALLQKQLTMGARHLDLGWGQNFWTHMWSDNMYVYVAQWGTIARFSCFALRGTRVRMKWLLSNSGGESFLNDNLGL